MSSKRSDSATGVGCESEEWGAGCCSPFENRNVPSCIQPGSPRESSDSTMAKGGCMSAEGAKQARERRVCFSSIVSIP